MAILRYILKKLLVAIPLLWGVVTLIFILLELSPGDISSKFFTPDMTPEVREMIAAKYGLDQPAWYRYLLMLRNVAVLDFGNSLSQERPVFDIIADHILPTLILSAITLVVTYPVGIAIGTWQAVRSGKPDDTTLSVTSLTFYSMPSFWLALMLQMVFAAWLGWLPIDGAYDRNVFDPTPSEALWDRFVHLILPGVAMGVASAAGVARYMRSSLVEVLQQDYIRTARAKGLSEARVIVAHGLRNALLPIVTLIALSMPALFGGSVLVEQVFSWPGMGRLILQAIFEQDTPLIVACFFVFTLVVVVSSLAADLAYALVDPRIRFDA
jgi:peptide/nickel transport system permease protein